jgi:hypothetical protein
MHQPNADGLSHRATNPIRVERVVQPSAHNTVSGFWTR